MTDQKLIESLCLYLKNSVYKKGKENSNEDYIYMELCLKSWMK